MELEQEIISVSSFEKSLSSGLGRWLVDERIFFNAILLFILRDSTNRKRLSRNTVEFSLSSQI